jgi:pyruvate/2-oxoglutarate dehydrogenase complex dihydrolipoamide acyltransferase (E2) component
MSDERVPVEIASVWPTDVEDAERGVVVHWFVRHGKHVEEGETICEIQVEKVSIDVPAPVTGELDEIVLAKNHEFDRDDTLAWILPA